HDGSPIEIEWTFRECNITRTTIKTKFLEEGGVLEPTLDVVEMFHWDRVDMDWRTVEILEYHDEIKVFQAKL
ncbi:MAG TPA: hypothetical protein VKI62_09415, partial [Bacteroidota bacterium]|nr:hypothetical protein [Bacteroidota bacterium]